jgi:hypothetical protein
MHVRKTAAICLERTFAAGGGVALHDECFGLATRHNAQILEAVKPDRSSATDTALVSACGIQLIPISQYLCGVAERTRCSLRGGVDW